jgi:hypothetical protein
VVNWSDPVGQPIVRGVLNMSPAAVASRPAAWSSAIAASGSPSMTSALPRAVRAAASSAGAPNQSCDRDRLLGRASGFLEAVRDHQQLGQVADYPGPLY